jgi:hypothetical protein
MGVTPRRVVRDIRTPTHQNEGSGAGTVANARLKLRYSWLRFRPAIQFFVFLLTTGLLVFLAENDLWGWFWPVLAVVAIGQGLVTC